MKYGHLFSFLRHERHIKQRQIVELSSSQSALSRFENGSDVTADTLISYLTKINVHPTEFFMIAENKDFIDSQNYTKRLFAAYYRKADRDTLVREERQKYNETGSITHLINATRIEAVYAKIHNLDFTYLEPDLEKIRNYLMHIEHWLIFELTLYLDLMFIFDDTFIRAYHNKMLATFATLPFGFAQRTSLQTSYAHNVTVMAFERNNYADLPKYISYFEGMITDDSRSIFAAIQSRAYRNLYTINTNPKQARDLLDTTLDDIKVLEKYGYTREYTDLKNFLLKYAII